MSTQHFNIPPLPSALISGTTLNPAASDIQQTLFKDNESYWNILKHLFEVINGISLKRKLIFDLLLDSPR
jgi:hypothetical protein